MDGISHSARDDELRLWWRSSSLPVRLHRNVEARHAFFEFATEQEAEKALGLCPPTFLDRHVKVRFASSVELDAALDRKYTHDVKKEKEKEKEKEEEEYDPAQPHHQQHYYYPPTIPMFVQHVPHTLPGLCLIPSAVLAAMPTAPLPPPLAALLQQTTMAATTFPVPSSVNAPSSKMTTAELKSSLLALQNRIAASSSSSSHSQATLTLTPTPTPTPTPTQTQLLGPASSTLALGETLTALGSLLGMFQS
jgi:hypothetical protein